MAFTGKQLILNQNRNIKYFVLAGWIFCSLQAFSFPSRKTLPTCSSVFAYQERILQRDENSDKDYIVDQIRTVHIDTKVYKEASFYFFRLPSAITYTELDKMMASSIEEMKDYGDSQVKIFLAPDHRTVAVASSIGLAHKLLDDKFRPKHLNAEVMGGSRIEYGSLINSRHFSYRNGVLFHMENFGHLIQFNPPLHIDPQTTTSTYLFHEKVAQQKAFIETKKIQALQEPEREQTNQNIPSTSPSISTGFFPRLKSWLGKFR